MWMKTAKRERNRTSRGICQAMKHGFMLLHSAWLIARGNELPPGIAGDVNQSRIGIPCFCRWFSRVSSWPCSFSQFLQSL